MVMVKKNPTHRQIVAKLMKAREDPKFMAFIREFVHYHTH